MEIFQFKYIDDVIPPNPELEELWMDKSNDKERIFIDLAIDPKCQGDLQRHIMF